MNVESDCTDYSYLKVNNRKLNETILYRNPWHEGLVGRVNLQSLGDQTGLGKLVLEEAPSMRTRKGRGKKKLARLIVKVENPSEIEELLSKNDSIHQLYKGQNGYALKFTPRR